MLEYIKKALHALRSPALGIVWSSSKGERTRIILLSILNMASAVLTLSYTMVMKTLVDAAVAGNGTEVRNTALLLAGLVLATILLGYVRRITQVKVKNNLMQKMRMETLRKLLHKQYAGMQKYHSGELVNRILSDVSVVSGGVVNIVPPILYLVIQLIGAAWILLRMNTGFMLIMLCTGALGAVGSFMMRDRMKRYHKDTQGAEDKLHARLQETLGNLRIVKTSGVERRMESEVTRLHQKYIDMSLRHGRFSALMGVGLSLIFRGSWFYALIWGCRGIYAGALTYGSLTAILQLVGQIQSPFEGLISTMSELFGTVASAERLKELYDIDDDDFRKAESNTGTFRKIDIKNVSFYYDEERNNVLNDFNLTINAGETTAIMGLSGCGKSTLFSLLLGLYRPNSGQIHTETDTVSIDGVMRGLYAYVPQGNALFSGTLRDNICMFCDEQPTDEKVWEAARLACIDGFIREQEHGLDTVIGERSNGLSEGQAQRIAIARALLTDRQILLLDESTSALDENTEAQLLKNISSLHDKTCLIVTHRKAALEICNRAIRIIDGKALEHR